VSHLLLAPLGALPPLVAAVDDDVALVEEGRDLIDDRVDGAAVRERQDEHTRLALLERVEQALGRGEAVDLVVRNVLVLLAGLEEGLDGRLFVVVEADDALQETAAGRGEREAQSV
jgi:hypothetical protein